MQHCSARPAEHPLQTSLNLNWSVLNIAQPQLQHLSNFNFNLKFNFNFNCCHSAQHAFLHTSAYRCHIPPLHGALCIHAQPAAVQAICTCCAITGCPHITCKQSVTPSCKTEAENAYSTMAGADALRLRKRAQTTLPPPSRPRLSHLYSPSHHAKGRNQPLGTPNPGLVPGAK